ncbi:hypothetical protein VKT23_012578 [Stygiomarasmius scandens]|uniref:DUF6699 domain-containing protein n=1 Tax=Marasmiellus scandens TaxID=2682957 RepID=A0ABR1J9L3_9AGAR
MVRTNVKFSPNSPIPSKVFVPGHRVKTPIRSIIRKSARKDSGIDADDLHVFGITKSSLSRQKLDSTRKARSVHFDINVSDSMDQSDAGTSVSTDPHFEKHTASIRSCEESENATFVTSGKPQAKKRDYHTRNKSIQKQKPRGKAEWHALLLGDHDIDPSIRQPRRLLETTTNLSHRASSTYYQIDPYAPEPFEVTIPDLTSEAFNLDALAYALPHPHRSSPSTSLPSQRLTPQLHSELGLYPLQWSLLHLPRDARSTLPPSSFATGLDLQEVFESPASPGVQTILIHVRQMGDVLDRLAVQWGPIRVSKSHKTPDITVLDVLEATRWYFHQRLTEDEERSLTRSWKDRALDSRVARILEEERKLAVRGFDDFESKHARHVREWGDFYMRLDLLSGCTQFGGLSIWECADMGRTLHLNLRLMPDFNSVGFV